MSSFQAPNCKHLVPRGKLAPLKPDWWWCETRGKEVYSAKQCENCPSYSKGHRQHAATTEESMGKAKVNWDGPASAAIADAQETQALWEYAVEIGYGKTAKALGMSFSSVHSAVKTRKDKQAAAGGAVPVAAKRAPKSETRCPEDAQSEQEEEPQVRRPVPALQLAEDAAEAAPTLREFAGYIESSGQGKRFAAWLSGARWAASRGAA